MKRIKFTESALDKINTKDVTKITNKVKKEIGKIGTVGILSGNVFFKIIRGGFIIF